MPLFRSNHTIGLRPALAVLYIALVPLSALGQPATPTQQPGVTPPAFGIEGWRYRPGANDVHFYDCERPDCTPGSKVSYRLYALGGPLKSLEQFRSEQERVARFLEEKGPPGTKVQVLQVEGDNRTEPPRFMRAVRLQTKGDGSKEFVISGVIMGTKLDASLISSSSNEKAAKSNYAQFSIGVALIVQDAIEKKTPAK